MPFTQVVCINVDHLGCLYCINVCNICKSDTNDPLTGHVIDVDFSLYKVLGPISCAVGGFILVAAIFYYCCYGLAEQSGRQRHTSSVSRTLHG